MDTSAVCCRGQIAIMLQVLLPWFRTTTGFLYHTPNAYFSMVIYAILPSNLSYQSRPSIHVFCRGREVADDACMQMKNIARGPYRVIFLETARGGKRFFLARETYIRMSNEQSYVFFGLIWFET